VKIIPVKFIPATRYWSMACELTSIKQYSHSFSSISLNNLFKLIASGVVCVGLYFLSPIWYATVEINEDFKFKLLNNSNSKLAMVVLPFVPVIPIILSFSDGFP